MKKHYTLCFLLLSFTLLITAQEWLIYDASVLPAETDGGHDTLDLTELSEDSRGVNFIEELIEDTEIPGNKILKHIQPDADAKLLYKHSFDSLYTGESFTIIARMKSSGIDSIDRIFDLQWRNGNANVRDELRIWPNDSIIELEKADVKVTVDYNLHDWHIYRVAVKGDSAFVYIDENPVPVVSDRSTATTSDKYIKVGDGSSTNPVGGYVDWIVFDTSGAYTPSDKGIPLQLTGLPTSWLVYDASIMPAETDQGGNMLDMSSESEDSRGANFVHEIIDDEDIPGNKILKHYQPDNNAKFLYRAYFDTNWTDNSFTLVAKLKGTSVDSIDRVFDIQWRHGNANARDELRIWPKDSTIELEKADTTVKVNYNLNKWHVYRIAVFGDSTVIYIDENPDPVLTGVTSEGTSDTYIKMGDASSTNPVGGFVDWIILDLSGATSPEEKSLPIFLTGLPEIPPSSDATLAELNVNSGVLSPAFSADIFTYDLELPSGSVNVQITGVKNNEYATVTGDGLITTVPGAAVIHVEAEDGTTLDYTINITIGAAPSSDTTLSALSVSLGTLTPTFNPDVVNYSVELPFGSASVDVEATANNANSTLSGEGEITSFPATVTITVTAEDGSTQDYIISITLEAPPSSDATLSSLNNNIGELVPGFNPETYEYEIIVPEGTTSLIIDVEANNSKSSVDGGGLITTIPSTVIITVTAEDGTEQEYQIEISFATNINTVNGSQISLISNPVTDYLEISNINIYKNLRIYSILGNIVYENSIHSTSMRIN
ncbi:cadherin-like beta sandwich domain-containing protein, partial [Bacteroidota bacterium]